MNSKEIYGTRQRSSLAKLVKKFEKAMRDRTLSTRDGVSNLRHVRGNRRIAAIRNRDGRPNYYHLFLDWTAKRFPEIRSQIELRSLPWHVRDWSRYALVVNWVPETSLYRSPVDRQQTFDLTAAADEHGVPIINRPERLMRMSKYDCAQQLNRLGVRTPRVEQIIDVSGFQRDLNSLQPPLLVREDLAHGGWSPIFFVGDVADARKIPLDRFAHPIAVKFVDVRDPEDQLVRKYRYMAMGNVGIAHTLQISTHWEVRSDARLLNQQTQVEEVLYADRPDPHHEVLQQVRRGVGLDFLAFDYSLDRNGELVIWEINVLPGLGIPRAGGRQHLTPPLERAMAATFKLYLEKAGLDVPRPLQELLTVNQRAVDTPPINLHAA